VPKRLTDLGYIEAQNAVFEHCSSQAQPERAAEMAADLVRSKVDVIIAFTNVNAFAANRTRRTRRAAFRCCSICETRSPGDLTSASILVSS
jgi:ABC-type uncharacterized transport system substrate-binding protein